jgi:hypothetical protein
VSNDRQDDPYAPPVAWVEDAAPDVPWYLGFRVLRALRWAFLVWLGSTIAVGVLGGFAGRDLGETHIEYFSDAAKIWAFFAAFSLSLILAAIVFPIGLFRRIRASDLARLASRRDPTDGSGVIQAREVAATHLHAPMYIVDYARMKKITLDDVHHEIRQGLLRTYWHEGICFVDADTSRGSPVSPDQKASHVDFGEQ